MWSLVRFPLAARKMGAQVIHTQYNVSPLSAGRAVTTVHDVSFFVNPGWYSAKNGILLRRFLPQSVKRASQVLTVSETSKREIERYIPSAVGKVTVTYNALDDDFDPPAREQARHTVMERFGVAAPYLFMIGSGWARKATALGVEVSARLHDSFPHSLIIAGKPGALGLASHQKAVGYVGSGDIATLYAGASAFLLPSYHEGFGIPILEAFAAQCPVVASSGGAIPEVAGEGAVIVPNWQPESWVGAVGSVLGDSGKLESLRLKGLERVKDFSWQETARRTIQVYEAVAN